MKGVLIYPLLFVLIHENWKYTFFTSFTEMEKIVHTEDEDEEEEISDQNKESLSQYLSGFYKKTSHTQYLTG